MEARASRETLTLTCAGHLAEARYCVTCGKETGEEIRKLKNRFSSDRFLNCQKVSSFSPTFSLHCPSSLRVSEPSMIVTSARLVTHMTFPLHVNRTRSFIPSPSRETSICSPLGSMVKRIPVPFLRLLMALTSPLTPSDRKSVS